MVYSETVALLLLCDLSQYIGMVGSLLLLTTVMGISWMVDLASSPLFFCLRFPSGAITGAPDSPLWHSLDEEVGEP